MGSGNNRNLEKPGGGGNPNFCTHYHTFALPELINDHYASAPAPQAYTPSPKPAYVPTPKPKPYKPSPKPVVYNPTPKPYSPNSKPAYVPIYIPKTHGKPNFSSTRTQSKPGRWNPIPTFTKQTHL